MKVLKSLFVTIVGIIAFLLIVALFVPKEYSITVSETINAPQKTVFDYVRLFENQKAYSEWIKPDPTVDIKITGTDGTVGAKQAWVSKDDNVGEGSQTITAMSDDKINIDIEFLKPMKGQASVVNHVQAVDSSHTKLTVEFHTSSPYPLNLPSMLFGKGMIEDTEKQILLNIKEILEKK